MSAASFILLTRTDRSAALAMLTPVYFSARECGDILWTAINQPRQLRNLGFCHRPVHDGAPQLIPSLELVQDQ